ncbi:MAG: efflux RND transporter permease subunit, partial [Gammaproteobacteria bacterium]
MNITKLAIDNNRLTLIAFLLIFLGGIQVFNQMPRDYDPGFIVRAAQVVTYFPGASPERVEQLISSKIEDVAKEIPELDFVTSESRTGVSVVIVNIKESYTEMRPIWDNLRRKIEDIEADLPSGTVGPFVNDEFGDVYGIVMTVTGDGLSYAELENITEDVKTQLQFVSEVAKIDILGKQDEIIYVEYNNSRLSELGLSSNQLSQILSARNIVLSGGAVNLGKETIALEPTGNFESIEDIGNTVIKSPKTNQVILLRDIATIKRDYVDPPKSFVNSSGKTALAVAISMRQGGNNILLGEMVKAEIEKFEQQYPIGIEFDLINFSPAEVDAKVKDFVNNLLQAVLVVSAVMLVSLGVRTGIIVAILIPTTMLLSLIVMDQFAIGLDQISLAALIIALGMLVDNGIVMSENIMVEMKRGKSAIQAAIDSANELKTPLMTASLTTSAAFLPIFLAESSVGEFTASLFKVVTITLICSWVISLTIIPLLCVYFMKVTPVEDKFDTPIYERYKSLLHWLLNNRSITLIGTLVIFIIVIKAATSLPSMFFPPSDRTYYKIEVTMPTGNSLEDTQSVLQ